MSTVSRLRTRLVAIVDRTADLIKATPVRHLGRSSEGILCVFPEYYWGELTPEQRAVQIALKREYEQIAELLTVLLGQAPPDLIRHLHDADKRFRVWLELRSHNWSLTPNPRTNEGVVRKAAADLQQILDVLEAIGSPGPILVPDTNSLLHVPDPMRYRSVVSGDAFAFVLLPTVLGELDKLKVEHRNADIREKARNMITRIKGWRQQGPLAGGVTVDKTIVVRACHSEPDMASTLSWLDPAVKDDRIIASVLMLQAEHPSARIILVTGDINLQNKVDAALIETADIPPQPDGAQL